MLLMHNRLTSLTPKSTSISVITAALMLVVLFAGAAAFVSISSTGEALSNARDRYAVAIHSEGLLGLIESSLEGILVNADLIVGSGQWMATPAVLSQISTVNEAISEPSARQQWCCNQELLLNLEAGMSALAVFLSEASEITASNNATSLLAELDAISERLIRIGSELRQDVDSFREAAQTTLTDSGSTTTVVISLSGMLMLALTFTAWFVLSRTISQPVKRLSEAARIAIDSKQFEAKSGGPLEIQELAGALSQLTSQLKSKLAKSEKERREEQAVRERLNAALRGGNLSWWEYTAADDRIVLAKLFDQQLGYEEGELIQAYGELLSGWRTLFHPEDWPQTERSFRRMVAGEDHEHRAEYRMLTKSGEWKWVRSVGRRVDLATGGGLCFIGIMEDIFEQKSLEANILQQRDELSLALETGEFGTWEIDPNSREMVADHRWARILGYDRSEINLTLTRLSELQHPDDRSAMYQAWKPLIDGTTRELDVRFRVLTATGEYRWIRTRGQRIERDRSGERNSRIIGIVYDIHEEVTSREELVRAKVDAESAVAAKANFLASMSHEIRTPMNAVIGMVDLLRHSDLGAEQARMLKTVSESSQSLLAIINDILDFSKIEAEALRIEKAPMNPGQVVENAVSAIAINAREKRLRLILFVDPDLPAGVIGDSTRLRQVIINLLSNAIKFTEHGQVSVLAEWMSPAGSPACLRLSVIDDGIGITEEAQQTLFEAFMQAESSTTRKYGGTGLGLAICQRLITLMGGKLDLQSRPGAGSTFTAEIPFESCESDSDAPRTDLAGIRVLMVVPEKIQSRALRSYLEDCSAEVLETQQLGSCLELCREFKAAGRGIDLVIVGPTENRNETFALPGRAAECELDSVRFLALVHGKRATPRAGKEEMESLEANPVDRTQFIATVAYCVGKQEQHFAAELGATPLRAATKSLTLEQAKAAGSLILVAEDNATNRDVIGRQLKLLGHTCVIVEDGAEALKSWQSGEFGLLLTDCHMPNMDGFELTKTIRELERSHPAKYRFPIVAITANALHGEAQRCLDAGMDAYLAKPIELDKLASTLIQWLPTDGPARDDELPGQNSDDVGATPEQQRHPGNKPIAGGAVDLSALQSLIGDDPAVIKEVLRDFVDPSSQIIQEIKAACSANSAEQAGLAAHKLKSAARSIGANALADLCFVLEQSGKSGDMDTVQREVTKIDGLMQAVTDFIEAA
jgi:PAS domain S-box-containing protein